jgi:hypothetical protein
LGSLIKGRNKEDFIPLGKKDGEKEITSQKLEKGG